MWAALRSVAPKRDPLPESVRTAAREAIATRADAVVAGVVDDTTAAGARRVRFAAPGVRVELGIEVQGSERRLVGRVVPWEGGALAIRQPSTMTVVDIGDDGRFAAVAAAGPTSLVADVPAGAVETEWIVL